MNGFNFEEFYSMLEDVLVIPHVMIDGRVKITTEVCISDIGGMNVVIVDKENKEFCNDGQSYIIHVTDQQAAVKVIQMAVLMSNIFEKTCELKER